MSSEASGLQAVFNRFLDDYRDHHNLSPIQHKACRHIEQCRTEALGGLLQHCDHCDYARPQYHSCRDRHCPKCQGRAQQAWCEQQCQATLPVTYYHLVFTLPHELNGWVAVHPKAIYRLLFQSVWETLSAFGRDPKRLNGTLGMTGVLHTWGQTLYRHVHLHCLVPGGALTDQGDWRQANSNYLFPVKALSRRFRGAMVSGLRRAAQAGEELIRRFLLHILPQGFMRIRHFGFLANRCRQAKLAQIRPRLENVESVSEPILVEGNGKHLDAGESTISLCPRCKSGRLIVLYEIAPRRIAYG